MSCYICQSLGRPSHPVVAICHHCSVALCREHLDDDLIASRRSGPITYTSCTHHPELRALREAGHPVTEIPGVDFRGMSVAGAS